MAKGHVLTEVTKVPQGVELNFVLGSMLREIASLSLFFYVLIGAMGRVEREAALSSLSTNHNAFMVAECLHACKTPFLPTACIRAGHLVLPLFSIALTVHLRRIPEVAILITCMGSAVLTVVTLAFVGWDYKVMAFFMLGRILYSLFAIMVAR